MNIFSEKLQICQAAEGFAPRPPWPAAAGGVYGIQIRYSIVKFQLYFRKLQ